MARMLGPLAPGDAGDALDGKHWDEVEEAVELLHEERWLDAILEVRKILDDSPRNPYAFYFLGVALYETGKYEPARDAYRAAIAISPRYLGARVHLSHTLRLLKDQRGAIEQAEIARRQSPDDPEVWHALGMALALAGRKDDARRYLEAFLRSQPELEVSLEVRAMLERIGPAPENDDDE
jgi:Flp pilus assembly protein TadD